jgi:hypothetical protein
LIKKAVQIQAHMQHNALLTEHAKEKEQAAVPEIVAL